MAGADFGLRALDAARLTGPQRQSFVCEKSSPLKSKGAR